MWICLNNSFVSIVESKDDSSKVYVRSRRKDDLENFLGEGEWQILETPRRDYRYRLLIDKAVLSKILADSVSKITYGNFKDSVEDGSLSRMYHEVWSSGVQWLDPNWLVRNGYTSR